MNHGDVGCVANVEIANPTAEHCFFFPPSLPCLSRPRRVLNHDLVESVLFFSITEVSMVLSPCFEFVLAHCATLPLLREGPGRGGFAT